MFRQQELSCAVNAVSVTDSFISRTEKRYHDSQMAYKNKSLSRAGACKALALRSFESVKKMEHWFCLKEWLLLNIYCFFSSVKKCRALLYGTQSYI
jgi:hypothetical protein